MTTAAAEPRERVGPYHIVQAIGAGGSARIDLARIDRAYGFQRHVVVKRPLEHLRGNAQVAASLRREARIGGLLRHPNLVAVLDAGTHDGYDYLVLEYVHGSSLRALMQTDAPGEVRELPLAAALAIVTDVARAMHEAHELTDETGAPLGLVHRDVSPGNILLGLDGTVKLADFGIAKETRVSTLSGSMHGTVTYMAPEQCQGHAFDRRADVFSLGVILYELVTGVRLFWADNDVASLHRVLSGNVPRPRTIKPALPSALEDIVMTAVAHDADGRYPTALELATAVELYAAGAGEILGARWIARAIEDIVGRLRVPWIAGPTLPDIVLPPPAEGAAPTSADLAPRDEDSLVALIRAASPDEQDEPPFGAGDDAPATSDDARAAAGPGTDAPPLEPPASPSPAGLALATTAPASPHRTPADASAAPSTSSSTFAPASSAGSSLRASPASPASPASVLRRRSRAATAAVIAAGLLGGSAVTALVMTRSSSTPATSAAPRSTSAEPPAPAPSKESQAHISSQSNAQPRANDPASASQPPAPDAPTMADGTSPPAPSTSGTTPATGTPSATRVPSTTGTSSTTGSPSPPASASGDRRQAVPTPAAVPSPPARNKRRKPASRAAVRESEPKLTDKAPPAAEQPVPPVAEAPSAGSAAAPAGPPAKVEWRPTMLLPTDGSAAKAPAPK